MQSHPSLQESMSLEAVASDVRLAVDGGHATAVVSFRPCITPPSSSPSRPTTPQLTKRRRTPTKHTAVHPKQPTDAHNIESHNASSTNNNTLKRPKNLPIINSLNHSRPSSPPHPPAQNSNEHTHLQEPCILSHSPTSSTNPPLLQNTSSSTSLPPSSPLTSQSLTKIFDYLYLGSSQDACAPQTYQIFGVTDVINLTTNHTPPPCHVTSFLRIAIDDNQHDSLLPHLPSALTLIEGVRQREGVVLVHCMAGVSRSASLVIAYLICHHAMTLASAYQFVKKKRPIIAPNFNFLGQLVTLEQQQQQKQQHQQLPQQQQQQQQQQQKHQHNRHHNQPKNQKEQITNQELILHQACEPCDHRKQTRARIKPQITFLNDTPSKNRLSPPPKPSSLQLSPFSPPPRPPVSSFSPPPRPPVPSFCHILPHNPSLDHPSPLESFEIQVS